MHLHRRSRRRLLLGALLITLVAVLLPPATPVLAATLRATDTANHVAYRLSGRDLTVALDPDTPAGLVGRLQGRRIRVACGRSDALTSVTRRWPATARSLRVRLPRTPQAPVFCGLEAVGSTDDLSYGFFD